jgi:hypothetical protein
MEFASPSTKQGPSFLRDLVVLSGFAKHPVTIYHLEEVPISGTHRSYYTKPYY